MSRRREDPKVRDKEMRQMARESFEGHRITQSQRYPMGARWLIQRPYSKPPPGWDWTMAAEIVVMAGGRIVVWGDLHPVMFAHFGPFQDPRQVVDWMGKCEDLGYYVHQKATIACREVVDVWEADVARFQLREMIRPEAVEDMGYGEKFVEVIEEALERCIWEHRHEFLEFVYNELGMDGGYESVCHVGMVLSPRVYYAHAALTRLSQLLDQEEKERGEREQREADGGGPPAAA